MGGRGSGRPAGLGMLTDKCEDFHAIDLAWFRRKKCLAPGYSGNLTWSRGGTRTGWISYQVQTSAFRLIYRTRRNGGEWRDVDELIPFVFTRTNFGGRRQWFECPSCRQPCRVLYGGAYFRCRKCHCLKYGSQYEPLWSRCISRAQKIRERCGGSACLDAPFPAKPKGMHWRTYDRLAALDQRLIAAGSRMLMSAFNLNL